MRPTLPPTMEVTWTPGSSQEPSNTGTLELVAVRTTSAPRTASRALSTGTSSHGHQGLHFFTEGRAGLGGAAEELHLLEVAYGGEGQQVVLGFGPRPEQAQDRGVLPRQVAGAHRAGGGGAQLGGAGGGYALDAETAHQNPFEGGVGGIEEDDARTAHVVVGLVVRGRGHELRVGQHADAAQAGHARPDAR